MKDNLANFRLRLLASLNDTMVLFLPHTLFWLYLSQSGELSQFITRLIFYLVLIVLPFIVLGFLYYSLLTTYFGATLGKFLTGLRVTNEKGEKLNLKRSLFRHTIGYHFSWLVFGLGYLSVIKDKNKQAFHDKAIGSKVIVQNNLWPLALLSLVLLVALNIYLVASVVTNFSEGNLPQELQTILQTVEEESINDLPLIQSSAF